MIPVFYLVIKQLNTYTAGIRKQKTKQAMTSPSKKLSFEFFPTRTPEGRAKQVITRKQLRQFSPEFFSCTSGAGGSTRDGTMQTIGDILAEGTAGATLSPGAAIFRPAWARAPAGCVMPTNWWN